MDLRDRRRGQRLAIEGREHARQGTAQVRLDDLAHDGEPLGWDLVAAALELVHQLVGEQALAGGDDLAELDVRGPEALGGDAHPAGQPGLRRRSALPTLAQNPATE